MLWNGGRQMISPFSPCFFQHYFYADCITTLLFWLHRSAVVRHAQLPSQLFASTPISILCGSSRCFSREEPLVYGTCLGPHNRWCLFKVCFSDFSRVQMWIIDKLISSSALALSLMRVIPDVVFMLDLPGLSFHAHHSSSLSTTYCDQCIMTNCLDVCIILR